MFVDYTKVIGFYQEMIDMTSAFTTNGAVSWHELSSNDPHASIAFYTKVFNWSFKTLSLPHGPYYVIESDGQGIGGICDNIQPNTPSHWTGYVTVNCVDDVAIKAKELGGELLYGPEDIPQIGRFCWIKDPQGAIIAAITYNNQAD